MALSPRRFSTLVPSSRRKTDPATKTDPISRLRGRFYDVKGFKLMPTFHPAYLLRHPDYKRVVWEDVQKIMTLLDLNKS